MFLSINFDLSVPIKLLLLHQIRLWQPVINTLCNQTSVEGVILCWNCTCGAKLKQIIPFVNRNWDDFVKNLLKLHLIHSSYFRFSMIGSCWLFLSSWLTLRRFEWHCCVFVFVRFFYLNLVKDTFCNSDCFYFQPIDRHVLQGCHADVFCQLMQVKDIFLFNFTDSVRLASTSHP